MTIELVKNETDGVYRTDDSLGIGEAFVAGIVNGDFDGELESIVDAVGARRRGLAVARASGIKVGDRVKTTDRITPKYLRGIAGVVLEKIGGKSNLFLVGVDATEYTGRYSHRLRVPGAVIERE